jgi:hypothetical protein
MLLVIHNKRHHLELIGKQPRSLENIPLETLFVTKLYESSPPSLKARSDLWGGHMLSAFVMTWILALEANCNQTKPYKEIYNIIK